MDLFITTGHNYYVFATGTGFKAGTYSSRSSAEKAMYSYCDKHGIKLECSERDKHEHKFTNHAGVRFYINRV